MALDMPATGSSMVTIKGINIPVVSIGVAANKALGTLVIPTSLIGIVKYAYLDLYIGGEKNNNANETATTGAQIIEIDNSAAGGYTTAINVPDLSLRVTGTTAGGPMRGHTVIPGTTDIKAKATLGETLTIRWTAAAANQALDLHDLHVELRLIF